MNLLQLLTCGPSVLEQELSSLKASFKPKVIYGAGTYAYVVKNYLVARGIEIEFFLVDAQYRHSDDYLGIPLYDFEVFEDKLEKYDIICGAANYLLLTKNLKKLGVDRVFVIDVPDFLNIPQSFIDFGFVNENAKKLERAAELLDDELSKSTFVAAINAKINEDPKYLEGCVEQDSLYFSSRLFSFGKKDVILDVGGFTGDSILEYFSRYGNEFSTIMSLEPLPSLYAQLTKSAESIGISNKCILINKGAWDKRDTLKIKTTEEKIDSKIDAGGETLIEVDTIDTLVRQFNLKPTFIKMDINGSESKALAGAKDTINQYKPNIAVKMHVPEDFYRLPFLLKEMEPTIKLYLRQRNSMSMMLVLYGVFE